MSPQPSNAFAAAVAAALLSALLAAAPDVPAQPASAPSATAAASLQRADRDFVADAAKGGLAEVELGRLARQKASAGDVKQFGEQMVQDHGKANDELKSLAQSKGIALPAAIDKSQQKDIDRLAKKSGAEFDREYMSHMVKDHRKDVSAFRKASESAKDPDVKAFAAKTLPTLQQHLKHAETVHDAVKGRK